jgi:heme-degrading monooxygenase HmoA
MLRGLLAALALFVAAPAAQAAERPINQLRIYEIFEGNKAAFHVRFRDHATRIMARHGFRILSMWEAKSQDKTEFVYLLQWRDEAAMKAAWTAFMADPEWAEIKRVTGREHGRFVGGIEDRTLVLTDYAEPLSHAGH